jgi:ring-1,2-phenylacetyl-CoA epoxidase subunit PaaD
MFAQNEIENSQALDENAVWEILENVKDPEIPVLSVVELGIITRVEISNENEAGDACKVIITPTFVGCPAIEVMRKNIYDEVSNMGFAGVEVLVDYETAWSSNRISAEGKRRLEKFGLAPPPVLEEELNAEQLNKVRCPHCGSTDTTLRSSFGSTLCRAIRFCFNCKQGFEQFKPV